MPKDIQPWVDVLKGLSWGGVAIATVISIIRGWLWPGWTVTKLLSDKDAQIDNLWRAREADQETIVSLTNQVHSLQHNGEMSVLLLEALRQAAVIGVPVADPVPDRVVIGEFAARFPGGQG